MIDNASVETNRDGGKWALSGFLYQAIALGGLIACSHDVGDHDITGSDLSALVEANGIIPELFDQDGVAVISKGPLINQCVFYQLKFSGSISTQVLESTEFKEIIASFITGTRRVELEGKSVYKYVLVTNKRLHADVSEWIKKSKLPDATISSIAASVQRNSLTKLTGKTQTEIKIEIEAVIGAFHSPVVTWTLQQCIDKVINYGKRFGLDVNQITNGIERLIGRQVAKGGSGKAEAFNLMALNTALTNFSNPGELTLHSIQKNHPPNISLICPESEIHTFVERKQVSSELDSLIITGKPLLILVGSGGMGKSTSLASWVFGTLKSKPDALIEVSHARHLNSKWIASFVRNWSGITGLFHDDDHDAIRRLILANEKSPFKLYLILDGIDETGGDPACEGEVRRLLNEFMQRNQSNLVASNAVLIATCRNEEWLKEFLEPTGFAPKNDISDILVNVDQFDDNEFSELVSQMNDSESRKILREINDVSTNYPANLNSLTIGNDRTVSSFGDVSLFSRSVSVLERELFDTLHHPVLWNVFACMGDSEKEALIKREQRGLVAFGQGITRWFTKKIGLRRGGRPVDQADIKELFCQISQLETSQKIHNRKDWIDIALRMGWERNFASIIFREAISSGLNDLVGNDKWQWSRQLICDSFIALGAETI